MENKFSHLTDEQLKRREEVLLLEIAKGNLDNESELIEVIEARMDLHDKQHNK